MFGLKRPPNVKIGLRASAGACLEKASRIRELSWTFARSRKRLAFRK